MAIDDNANYTLTGAQVKDLANQINGKADSGDIPTVNDATLTIQKNGTTVNTFTANASSNVTANITVPTQFSDLSGTITNSQIASSTIERDKIKWSTFRYSFTATSDGNGFVPVPNTVVKPATGFILAVRCANRECFTQVYNDAGNKDRYTIKCESWDRYPVGNTSIALNIIYILLT